MEAALGLVQEEWRRHIDTDFAFLRRLPSTHVRSFLDFLASATTATRENLFHQFPHVALCVITGRPITGFGLTAADLAAREAVREQATQHHFGSARYLSLRMQRTLVTVSDKHGGDMDLSGVDTELIRSTPSAKATLLKKLLKRDVSAKLGLKLVSTDPGNWYFEGEDYRLCFDFGGMDSQLRYAVEYRPGATVERPRRLAYEDALGLLGFCPAGGDWNFITEPEAQNAVDLVLEIVPRVVLLRNQVRSLLRPDA